MRAGWACVAAAGIFLTCGSMIQTACAQQADGSSYTDLSQYLVNGNQAAPQQQVSGAAYNATSIVRQAGQNNSANAVIVGAGDTTTQMQNGSNNTSTVSINGAQNSLSTTQIGNSNSVALGVVGNGNTISNLQVGNGLSYGINIVGAAQNISVQQYGRK
jgi:hypothetical protein